MPKPKRPIRRVACIGEVMIELIAGPDNSATDSSETDAASAVMKDRITGAAARRRRVRN